MKSSVLIVTYRVLLAVFIVMGFVWLGGTVWALLFRAPQGTAPAASLPAGGSHIFTGMGRLRLPLASPSSAMAIVSVTFPYDPGDKAFSEELASKAPDFRNTAAEYFNSFSAGVLQKKNEDEIKTELLNRFNTILRLGKIEILYFDDFMIID